MLPIGACVHIGHCDPQPAPPTSGVGPGATVHPGGRRDDGARSGFLSKRGDDALIRFRTRVRRRLFLLLPRLRHALRRRQNGDTSERRALATAARDITLAHRQTSREKGRPVIHILWNGLTDDDRSRYFLFQCGYLSHAQFLQDSRPYTAQPY